MQRLNNEDAARFHNPPKPWIKQAMGSLAIIADGMGGHPKGEKASKLATEIISDEYYKKVDPPEKALEKACIQANNVIASEGNAFNQHIGTTCTAMAITQKTLFLLHIGDSRAYLLSKKKLEQLTTDHTLSDNRHGGNHILTRSLGINTVSKCPAEIIKINRSFSKGDRILLCTDGLYSHISFNEMEATLNDMTLAELEKQWVKWVLKRGAFDNFSFIVIEPVFPT